MSDLISRQAAIVECNKRGAEHIGYAIAHLPTVQPEKAQLFSEGATSDLISRQAAIDALDCINGTEEVLRSLPPAQPEPKEGHWIEVAGELECSECHTVFTDLYPDYADSVACPHCGARMKGERQK